MPTAADHVYDFHKVFGHPIASRPEFRDADYTKMRLALIEEEFKELQEAVRIMSIVGVADALGDLVYVIYGMAISMGIPLDEIVEEIHFSNMTKLDRDGKPIYREDGKVLKGPNYRPPRLGPILMWHERSYQLMMNFNTDKNVKKEAAISDGLSEATERDPQTP